MNFIKSIPVTSDMVSLWIPSGTSRAVDIIRGNHGQCSGTHPNILANTGLLDTSLGWHFDGTNDYVGGINFGSITTYEMTQGCWIRKDGLVGTHRMGFQPPFAHGFATANFYVHTVTSEGTDSNTPYANIGVLAETWHFLVITKDTLNENEAKVYLDAELKETGDLVNAADGYMTLAAFALSHTSDSFDGYIALPFVANKVWSAVQVNNFYLATKGLFSPRG